MASYTRLHTLWEPSDTPLSEYPRPQFARDSYKTLNGYWDYAILKTAEKFEGNYQGKILVPYSPETLLSGCPDGTIVMPNDTLYYKRAFNIEEGFIKAHTDIHFDAVDYYCKVTLNGIVIGEHFGGYMPFKLDASKAIKTGENEIKVEVVDPSDTSYHARGKQKIKHNGIWYTPQSGIWQSVWIESMPEVYLKDVTIIPDIDNNKVLFKFDKSLDRPIDVLVLDNGKQIAAKQFEGDEGFIELENYELWSPENPKLYDLAFKVGDDIVKSYFGMRKFSWVKDKNGFMRMGLNNKPYFNTGVLDQGYWSDGLLTPPSNQALEYDVKLIKSMGFNMIRKHIKVEPLRWYYHCDKEGILVWQDMVSGGTNYHFQYIGFLAVGLNIHIKDNTELAYKRLARESKDSRDEYEKELETMMDYLKNVVSINCWVPFNEGWGQFDSIRITKLMKEKDPTRMIDSVSGWNDQEKYVKKGEHSSDAKSMHIYFTPIVMPKDERCLLLSEFGGYAWKVEDHVYSPIPFGYRQYNTREALNEAFKKLYEKKIIPNIKKGLSASVYTQTSDVEHEINGFVTFDRKVVKYDIEMVKALNKQLKIEE